MVSIKVFEHPVLSLAVSGREIYELIAKASSKASRDTFSDWFRERERKLPLSEGADFITLPHGYSRPDGNRKAIEFIVSLDAAKKIADWQPAKRGQGLLQYLNTYATTPALSDQSAPLFSASPVANPVVVAKEVAPAPIAQMSPAQQLLQQAQKLVDEEEANRADNGQHSERLSAVEAKVDILVKLLQDAVKALAPAGDPLPAIRQPETTRTRLNRLVDSYAAAKGFTHQQVWRSLYGQLNTDFHFDAWLHIEPGKDNYLDVVEKHGQLENMYQLASQRLAMAQA